MGLFVPDLDRLDQFEGGMMPAFLFDKCRRRGHKIGRRRHRPNYAVDDSAEWKIQILCHLRCILAVKGLDIRRDSLPRFLFRHKTSRVIDLTALNSLHALRKRPGYSFPPSFTFKSPPRGREHSDAWGFLQSLGLCFLLTG
jgi:hypothetical protein